MYTRFIMKILFVILLLAGGLIYAGSHGAFKQNSVEKSFGIQASDSKKSNQVALNKPSVSSIEGFTKTNASSGTIKDGSEISIAKDEVKTDATLSQNDESDPYSKHVDEKKVVADVKVETGASNDSQKTFMQKITDAKSITEVLALLKDVVAPSSQDKTDQAKDAGSSIATSTPSQSVQTGITDLFGDSNIVSSPSDKNPLPTPTKPVEIKKDTMVVVLPVVGQTSETDRAAGTVTVKSNSSSSALLSVCKTQYINTKDVRIINQVSTFNVVSKSIESMTFEVECL